MCGETISCDLLQSPFSNGHVDLIGRVKAGMMSSDRKQVNMRGRREEGGDKVSGQMEPCSDDDFL